MTLSVRIFVGVVSVLLPAACTGCGGQGSTNADRALLQSSESPVALASKATDSAAARQLITKATFRAETSDMDGLSRALTAQVANAEGFVASFGEQRYAGERREGTWTIRLPTNQFEVFVQWLDKQVTITGRDLSTQDVSEEVVDLAARLTNKQNTEQRLTKLLDERVGKLDDLLSVEREIDRAREEIERLEGRQRFLQDRISLCTVTLTVTTRSETRVVGAPTFSLRISETWSSSVAALSACFEKLVLFAVGLVPWLPMLLAVSYVIYRMTRAVYRRLGKWVASATSPPQLKSSAL